MKLLPEVWTELSRKWPFLIVLVIFLGLEKSTKLSVSWYGVPQFKIPWEKISNRRRNCKEKKNDGTVKLELDSKNRIFAGIGFSESRVKIFMSFRHDIWATKNSWREKTIFVLNSPMRCAIVLWHKIEPNLLHCSRIRITKVFSTPSNVPTWDTTEFIKIDIFW